MRVRPDQWGTIGPIGVSIQLLTPHEHFLDIPSAQRLHRALGKAIAEAKKMQAEAGRQKHDVEE